MNSSRGVSYTVKPKPCSFSLASGQQSFITIAFPATIAFMAWYILYIVCNNWARDFMNTEVIGNINVALVWGLLQFVSTFTIAYFYARHAKKSLDPLASKLRNEFDQETGR